MKGGFNVKSYVGVHFLYRDILLEKRYSIILAAFSVRFELLELGKTTTTHVCSFVLTQDVSTALEHRNLASVNA